MIKLEIVVTLTDQISLERAAEIADELRAAFERGREAGDVADIQARVLTED